MSNADKTFTLSIQGMHCNGCVKRVTKALQDIVGVHVDGVDIGSARGTFDPLEVDADRIVQAVGRIGYPARVGELG